MAHEIDAIELVAEALAGRERGLEIGLSERIRVDIALGDDGGIAWLAADQRNLAEKIARSQPRYLVIGTDHLDFAIRDQEELLPGLPLPNDRFPGREMALLHMLRAIPHLLPPHPLHRTPMR